MKVATYLTLTIISGAGAAGFCWLTYTKAPLFFIPALIAFACATETYNRLTEALR